MKKTICAAATLMLLAGSAFSQTMYKCGGTYQQTPCDGEGSGAIAIKTGARSSNSSKKPKSGLSTAEFNKYYVRGEPAVGMNEEQLQKVMGNPTKVNPANYQGVRKDQIIYDKNGDRIYVYTEEGIVTAIQKTQGGAPKDYTENKRRKVCPTPLEIRNAEVSANIRSISEEERLKRLEIVKEMRKCGRD